MVNDNAPAITAKECQAQCAALSTCNFWDFGEGFCRLRSDKGPEGKIEHWGYSFGTKNCRVGKTSYTSYVILISIQNITFV